MELLLGAGARREKRLRLPGTPPAWTNLVTLDINADHGPDVVWDLARKPWPFAENAFDEVHAYEVLEHLGQQGDYRAFFADFSEIWRILRPDGLLVGTSPHWSSPWCWMDPGHTRALGPECLVFLDQGEYIKQVGVTPMSDYRFVYKADFEVFHCLIDEKKTFQYGLRAVKPSRCPT